MQGDEHRLAREQAALRRVASFAAGDTSIEAVFDAVVSEASALLEGAATAVMRHDGERGASVVVAECGGLAGVGDRFPLAGEGVGVRPRSGPDPTPAGRTVG